MVVKEFPVTERQLEVLDAIANLIVTHGKPPTFREIGDVLGISSPNGVVGNINALKKKGYLRTSFQDSGKEQTRGVHLTRLATNHLGMVRIVNGKAYVLNPGPMTREEAVELASALILAFEEPA